MIHMYKRREFSGVQRSSPKRATIRRTVFSVVVKLHAFRLFAIKLRIRSIYATSIIVFQHLSARRRPSNILDRLFGIPNPDMKFSFT